MLFEPSLAGTVQESEAPMDDQIFKDALLRKRTEILGTGGINKAGPGTLVVNNVGNT